MLKFAVVRSPRVDSLIQGTVPVIGLDVEWLPLGVGEIFDRMLQSLEFDASEMALPYALLAQERGAPPLVALPIFLGRGFRHQMLFTRASGGVAGGRNLVGRSVALPDFSNADALWIRESLARDYAVDPRKVHWIEYGRGGRMALSDPAGYELRRLPGARPEELLRAGEADVAYLYGQPGRGPPPPEGTTPLFDDPEGEERRSLTQSGILPITHCVVMRQDVYEKQPKAARSLYDAFVAARDAWYRDVEARAEPIAELPWHELTEIRAHMGQDFWPHGISANRHVLAAALRRLSEDGYLNNAGDPADWFVPELRET